jgi:hypothetical protein
MMGATSEAGTGTPSVEEHPSSSPILVGFMLLNLIFFVEKMAL